MKLSKSIYYKIKLSLALLAVVITAIMLYFAIGVNAFASEDQADPNTTEEAAFAEEPSNDTINLYFDYVGEKAPNITIYNNITGALETYVIGEAFVIEQGVTVNYFGDTEFNLSTSDQSYRITFERPIGYDFIGFTPTLEDGMQFYNDTTISASYEKYEGKYTIYGYVSFRGEDALSGVNVCLYDNDFNPTTDVIKTNGDGKYIFENIEADKAVCNVMVWLDGYTNHTTPVTSNNYEESSHTAIISFSLYPVDTATINLQGKNTGHKYFTFNLKLIDELNPEVILREQDLKCLSMITGETDIVCFGNFTVKDNGALYVEYSLPDNFKYVQELIPFAKDGYTLDYWMIGNGSGEMKKYVPGKDTGFYIDRSEKLIAEAYYKEGSTPTPVPDPGPVPDTPGENANANSATGDNLGYIFNGLAILTVIGAMYVVFSRKRFKNN